MVAWDLCIANTILPGFCEQATWSKSPDISDRCHTSHKHVRTYCPMKSSFLHLISCSKKQKHEEGWGGLNYSEDADLSYVHYFLSLKCRKFNYPADATPVLHSYCLYICHYADRWFLSLCSQFHWTGHNPCLKMNSLNNNVLPWRRHVPLFFYTTWIPRDLLSNLRPAQKEHSIQKLHNFSSVWYNRFSPATPAPPPPVGLTGGIWGRKGQNRRFLSGDWLVLVSSLNLLTPLKPHYFVRGVLMTGGYWDGINESSLKPDKEVTYRARLTQRGKTHQNTDYSMPTDYSRCFEHWCTMVLGSCLCKDALTLSRNAAIIGIG